MLKIVVIGAGNHSVRYHLPSLKEYNYRNPGIIKLSALCDINIELAKLKSREFGFGNYYGNFEKMIDVENPDGCIAITPIGKTKNIVSKIIPKGVSLLMEKPLGNSLEEAKEICSLVENTQAHVMVSVNRRFNPLIETARSYLNGRKLECVRAVMMRHNRTESNFFYVTALHSIDLMRFIAGEINDYKVSTRIVDKVNWYNLSLDFKNGEKGSFEVMPNCGCRSEIYEFIGADYRIVVDITEDKGGNVTLWQNERIVKSNGLPLYPNFESNGTYNETVAFIDSIINNHKPSPAPSDILHSMEICIRIQNEYGLHKIM